MERCGDIDKYFGHLKIDFGFGKKRPPTGPIGPDKNAAGDQEEAGL